MENQNQKNIVKVCPRCHDVLVEGCVIANGDKVLSYTCERCNKVYYENSPYTSFVPLTNYQMKPIGKRPQKDRREQQAGAVNAGAEEKKVSEEGV